MGTVGRECVCVCVWKRSNKICMILVVCLCVCVYIVVCVCLWCGTAHTVTQWEECSGRQRGVLERPGLIFLLLLLLLGAFAPVWSHFWASRALQATAGKAWDRKRRGEGPRAQTETQRWRTHLIKSRSAPQSEAMMEQQSVPFDLLLLHYKKLSHLPVHYTTMQVLYLWMKERAGVSFPSTHNLPPTTGHWD